MKQMRDAFTLIEIMISVLILSVSIIGVFKIYNENQGRIVYIMERNKKALEDSLFLGEEVIRYHKEKKTAYDLMPVALRPTKNESRKLLKTLSRDIYIPESILIIPKYETGIRAQVQEVKLKGEFPASYYHFKIMR